MTVVSTIAAAEKLSILPRGESPNEKIGLGECKRRGDRATTSNQLSNQSPQSARIPRGTAKRDLAATLRISEQHSEVYEHSVLLGKGRDHALVIGNTEISSTTPVVAHFRETFSALPVTSHRCSASSVLVQIPLEDSISIP